MKTARYQLPIDKGQWSDGFHTFDELYEHRTILMAALMRFSGAPAWRSRKHHDGTMFDGFFIVGMTLPLQDGLQITYHVEEKYWHDFSFATVLDQAPEYDGHSSADVLQRLRAWLLLGVPSHRPEVLCERCGKPVSMIDRNVAGAMHPLCAPMDDPTAMQ